MKRLFPAVLSVLLLGMPLSAADLILHGGKIFTADPQNTIASAIAIEASGSWLSVVLRRSRSSALPQRSDRSGGRVCHAGADRLTRPCHAGRRCLSSTTMSRDGDDRRRPRL